MPDEAAQNTEDGFQSRFCAFLTALRREFPRQVSLMSPAHKLYFLQPMTPIVSPFSFDSFTTRDCR
jgi:hypothetical protein